MKSKVRLGSIPAAATALLIVLAVGSGCDRNRSVNSDEKSVIRLKQPDETAAASIAIELGWSMPFPVDAPTVCSVYVDSMPHLRSAQVYGVHDTTCLIEPLKPGAEYFWQVKAFRGDSLLGYSDVASYRPPLSPDELVFPLGPGTTWEYTRDAWWENCTGQSPPSWPAARGRSTVETLDTLHDSIVTAVIYSYWEQENGSSNWGRAWMRNITDGRTDDEEGLFQLAYEGMGWSGPAPKVIPESEYLLFRGERFSSIRELADTYMPSDLYGAGCNVSRLSGSTIDQERPRRWLAYPLVLGKRWRYISLDSGHVWNMDKEVVGEEIIQTPLGPLPGFQIRWYWDIDGDGVWETDIRCVDDFCHLGVVNRRYEFDGIFIVDYSGDTLGTCDAVDTYALTRVYIDSRRQ